MRAAVFTGEKAVSVREREVPRPGPHEVLVRTGASAICRSDMSLYNGAPIVGGAHDGPSPFVPGHEPAGTVEAIGSAVTHLAPGDRVAGYLAIGCGHCTHCLAGYRMLCARFQCVGFDVDGGDAEYLVLPEINCLSLPDELSFVAGALMTDMIGSQYHVQTGLAIDGGHHVGVVGLGPMGAAAVLVAKALGARVTALDVLAGRLEHAADLGADHALDSGSDDVRDRIAELTGGRGFDVVVDCSGAPAGQNLALDAAAKRGAVALVGESRRTEINPSDQIIRKLLRVVGGWYFPLGDWDAIVRLVQDRQIPVEKLVTHTYDLEDADEAFRAFDRRETEKAVFVFDTRP